MSDYSNPMPGLEELDELPRFEYLNTRREEIYPLPSKRDLGEVEAEIYVVTVRGREMELEIIPLPGKEQLCDVAFKLREEGDTMRLPEVYEESIPLEKVPELLEGALGRLEKPEK